MGQQELKQLGLKAASGPAGDPAKEETWAWCSTDSCFYSFFEFVHSFIQLARFVIGARYVDLKKTRLTVGRGEARVR